MKAPLAQIGCRVIAHKSPTAIRIWDLHGLAGFHEDSTEDICRYFRVHVPTTKTEITTNTLEYADDKKIDLPYTTQD